MRKLITFSLSLLISSLSYSALHIRDLDGDWSNGHEGVYDDVLDITWLADANLALTIKFNINNINSSGSMTTSLMDTFLLSANVSNLLGYSGWRAPKTAFLSDTYNGTTTYDGSSDRGYNIGAPINLTNPNGQSTNFLGSELSYMYYQNLGGLARCSSSSLCLQDSNLYGLNNLSNQNNYSLFSGLKHGYYLSETKTSGNQIFFDTTNGAQGRFLSNGFGYVWLVHDGDIGLAPVPIPAAAWLFASALIGLLAAKRKY